MITGLLSGFFFGISNATRKFFVAKIDRWVMIRHQMYAGAILSFALIIVSKESFPLSPSFPVLGALIIFSLGQVLLQVLLFIGFQNFNLNIGSIVLASQMVFALLIGILILNEPSTMAEIIGSVFVATAVVLSNLEINRLFRSQNGHAGNSWR